jgi:hypothetical protein
MQGQARPASADRTSRSATPSLSKRDGLARALTRTHERSLSPRRGQTSTQRATSPHGIEPRLVEVRSIGGDHVATFSDQTHIDDIVAELKKVMPQARPANVAINVVPVDKSYESSDASLILNDEYPLKGATRANVVLENFDVVVKTYTFDMSRWNPSVKPPKIFDCVYVTNPDRKKLGIIRRSLHAMGYSDFRGPFTKYPVEVDRDFDFFFEGVEKILDCELRNSHDLIPGRQVYHIVHETAPVIYWQTHLALGVLATDPYFEVHVRSRDRLPELDDFKFAVFFLKRNSAKWMKGDILPFTLEEYLKKRGC